MTPKEKAKQLFRKHEDAIYEQLIYTGDGEEAESLAKKAAIITVEEIINHHSQEQGLYRIDTYYYQQVKSELQSL